MTVGSLSGVDRDRTWAVGDGWSGTANECRAQADRVEWYEPALAGAATGETGTRLVAAQRQLHKDLHVNAERCDSLARQCYHTANAGELNDLIVIGSGIALLAQLAIEAMVLGGGALLKAPFNRARTQSVMNAARVQCAQRVIASGAEQVALRAGMNPVAKFALIGAGWGAAFGGVVQYGAQAYQMEVLHHTDHIEWNPVLENTFIGGFAGAFGGAAALWAAPGIGQLIRRAGGGAWATAGGTVLIGAAAGLAGGIAGAAGGLALGAPLTWKDLKAAIVTGIGGGVAGTLVQGLGAARSAAAALPALTVPPRADTPAPHAISVEPGRTPLGEPSTETLAAQVRTLGPQELRRALDNSHTQTSRLMEAFYRGEEVPPADLIRTARDQHSLVTAQAHRLFDEVAAIPRHDPMLAALALAKLEPDIARLDFASQNVAHLVGTFRPGDLPGLWGLHAMPNQTGTLLRFFDPMVGAAHSGATPGEVRQHVQHVTELFADLRAIVGGGWSRKVDDYVTPLWDTPPDLLLSRAYRDLTDTVATFDEVVAVGGRHPDFPMIAARSLIDYTTIVAHLTNRTRNVDQAAKYVDQLGGIYDDVIQILQRQVPGDGLRITVMRDKLETLLLDDRADHRASSMHALAATLLPAIVSDVSSVVAQLETFAELPIVDVAAAQTDNLRRETRDSLATFWRGQDVPTAELTRLAYANQASLWRHTEELVNSPGAALAEVDRVRQLRDEANAVYNLAGALRADVDDTNNLHTLREHLTDTLRLAEEGADNEFAAAVTELDESYRASPHRGIPGRLDGYLPPQKPDPELPRALTSAKVMVHTLPAAMTAPDARSEYLRTPPNGLADVVKAAHYYMTRTTNVGEAILAVSAADRIATWAALARDPQAPLQSPFTTLLANLRSADPMLMRDIGIAAFERDQTIANAVRNIIEQHPGLVAELHQNQPLVADSVASPPIDWNHATLADWARGHDGDRLRTVVEAYQDDARRLLVGERPPGELIKHARVQQALAWELVQRVVTDGDRPIPASDSYQDLTWATDQMNASLLLDLERVYVTAQDVFDLADAAGVDVRAADTELGFSRDVGLLQRLADDSVDAWWDVDAAAPSALDRSAQFERLTTLSRGLEALAVRITNHSWSDRIDDILSRPFPFDDA